MGISGNFFVRWLILKLGRDTKSAIQIKSNINQRLYFENIQEVSKSKSLFLLTKSFAFKSLVIPQHRFIPLIPLRPTIPYRLLSNSYSCSVEIFWFCETSFPESFCMRHNFNLSLLESTHFLALLLLVSLSWRVKFWKSENKFLNWNVLSRVNKSS